MLERAAERIAYYQHRNAAARASHTKTRINHYATLGIEVDQLEQCQWET